MVSGELTALNIFDFITGSADFAISRQLVDVRVSDSETLDDAGLLTIGLSDLQLWVGVSGVGLEVSDGNIGIAVLTEPVATPRTWTALSANSLDIELKLPGITAAVEDVAIEVARSAPDGSDELDWTTAIDLDAADGFGTAGTVDPGATLDPAVELEITQTRDRLVISGELTNLNVFNLITGSAHFAVTRQRVDVKVSPTQTLDNAGLLTIALSELNLDVGVDGVGLSISSGNIGIATINEAAPGTRTWTALSANDIAVALDLPGIAASVTGAQLKVGSGPTELDWNTAIDLDPADGFGTAGTVDPGAALEPAVDLSITQSGNALLVSGLLTNLNVFDFITGSASFAVSRQLVDLKVSAGETLDNAGLLTIALSNLNLSVGVSGVGLTVSGGNLGIATINEVRGRAAHLDRALGQRDQRRAGAARHHRVGVRGDAVGG